MADTSPTDIGDIQQTSDHQVHKRAPKSVIFLIVPSNTCPFSSLADDLRTLCFDIALDKGLVILRPFLIVH